MTGYWTLIDPMSSFLFLKTAEAEDISVVVKKMLICFRRVTLLARVKQRKQKNCQIY